MTSAAPNRLQDAFLGAARGQPITLYLTNGVRLQGALVAQDRHSVLLVRGGGVQLIYKHALSTAVPTSAIDVAPSETSAG